MCCVCLFWGAMHTALMVIVALSHFDVTCICTPQCLDVTAVYLI